jgi:hypothetical protein
MSHSVTPACSFLVQIVQGVLQKLYLLVEFLTAILERELHHVRGFVVDVFLRCEIVWTRK